MGKPIFTITTSKTNKTYNIYLDGHVEGFDEDISISNFVPSLLSTERAKAQNNLLINMINQQRKFIQDCGFSAERLYSSKEDKSISDGVAQGEKLYSFKTVHKSKTTSDT